MNIHLPSPKVTVEQVIEEVAERYGHTPEELCGPRGSAALAFARQLAMSIAYETCKDSLQQVGIKFGGRDHSTVMHARKVIKRATTPPAYESASTKRERLELIKLIEDITNKLTQK